MIEIQEVKTKKQLRAFAKFPVILYKDCPYYVPQMRSDEKATFNPKKNFSLDYCEAKGFLCYKDGKLAGRIAGIISKIENEKNGKKMIRFSRFEAIDDLDVFKALLSAVENYGKENGAEFIHGPWGFNDQDREGMLTFGYDERSTYATNYYYPYFAENMRKLGYLDESKWKEFRFKIPKEPYERITNIAEKIKKRYGITDVADTMSVKHIIKKYGNSLFDAINESYGKLDGFVKYEGKSKDSVIAQFGSICNNDYVSILVDKNDKVVGFGVVIASIADALIKNRGKLFPFGIIGVLKAIKNPKDLEMCLIGVTDEYKNCGLNAIIVSRIMNNVVKNGITNIESNPMLEHNLDILQSWKFADYDVVKCRQTFQKQIVGQC